ncbi:N-ethylmaleimide reductase [Maribacter vaceletii]|uniref:N-ethylmaleimide reductase n=1 Tax=Maribacter vaceletii TaxID=1206816 RepID=A0A495DU18_9FLAO|nr:alkene reductase [Maribacter vaceletii]RKR07983.1 N-ethylmaleimide reductase [Maribacter vaceletii]
MLSEIKSIFEPVKIGKYIAKNKIFMAPMSRYRAQEGGINPDITIEYYKQRASAGLIVAESTQINDGAGGIDCPGIYNETQAKSWKKVTDAVHKEGGLIFLQLWHAGRASHPSVLPEGRQVVAPSAIASTQEVMTYDGMQVPTMPHALSLSEITEIRSNFATASKYALEAGFDGVEIHAAGGFLIDSFLQDHSNKREDQYGGSLENRFRFLKGILDDSVAIWGNDRVGIKLSPISPYNDMGKGNVLETFTYVYNHLNTYNLAFLEVNEVMPFTELSEENKNINKTLRSLYKGTYIANGGFNPETAAKRIDQGTASAISFGRPFIANPDLPERFKQDAPLNELDMNTFYGGNYKGYTDYPFLKN